MTLRTIWLRKNASLAVVVAILTLILTAILDPRLAISSPIEAHLLNFVLPLLAFTLVLASTGRVLTSAAISWSLIAFFTYVASLKYRFLKVDLLYSDLKIVPSVMMHPDLVLGFIDLDAISIAAAVAGTVAVLVAVAIEMRGPVLVRNQRIFAALFSVLGLSLVIFTQAPSAIVSVNWNFPMQIEGASKVGVYGNLMLGKMAAGQVRRKFDSAAIATLLADPHLREALKADTSKLIDRRPDIVVVQSESLFDPSLLCGTSDQSPLKRMSAENPLGPSELKVPVFGSRTLQTEFEVLTGIPVARTGSVFAYYDLMQGSTNSLPWRLRSAGYRTIAIHPSLRAFWQRDVAYPRLGFESFIDGDSFFLPTDYSRRSWVSDAALVRSVVSQLSDSGAPAFVFAVSIDNHGPWGAYAADTGEDILQQRVAKDVSREISDYVDRAVDADKAFGMLIDTLKHRKRPTLVLYYGDHLPALGSTYAEVCFKDGAPPEVHHPPFKVWANYPLPEIPHSTSSFLLPGMVARLAGLDLGVLLNVGGSLAFSSPPVDNGRSARLEEGYYNLALRELSSRERLPTSVPRREVGPDHALDMMLELDPANASLQTFKPNPNVRALDVGIRRGQVASKEIVLGKALRWVTIRPFIVERNGACSMQGKLEVELVIKGDGHVLYESTVAEERVLPVTLDVTNVQVLRITAHTDTKVSEECMKGGIHITRLACAGGECKRSASETIRDAAKAESIRIDSELVNLMYPLRANFDEMMSRRISTQEALLPFERDTNGHQLFMHPAKDKEAAIEFSVLGLREVVLSPKIRELSTICEGNPDSGVVEVTINVDGKIRLKLVVDRRNLEGPVVIQLQDAKKMRVSVNAAGQDTCDWFSVGFPKLEANTTH